MESSPKKIDIRFKYKKVKTDSNKKDDYTKKCMDLQTLFAKLSQFEKLMFKLDELKEAKNFEQIKNIDLIKVLRGTKYSTKIEQYFEFDLVFKKLKEGFEELQCSIKDCENRATFTIENKNGESSIQYCEHHFHNSNSSTESPKILEFELKLHKILFDELEEQLIYIQDRIDYFKSDKNEINNRKFVLIEDEVQRNLDYIKSTLKTMTERIYQAIESRKNKEKIKASMIFFDEFSFVRKDLNECRERILTILSLISGLSSKNQAASLVQAMTDFEKEIDLEEKKDEQKFSVPYEIYNREYEMVNFPSQCIQSIKNYEQKIITICEYLENFQESALELMKSFNPIKHILQEQLDQLPLIKQRGEKRIDDDLKYMEERLTKKLEQTNKRVEDEKKEITQIKNDFIKLKEHVEMHDEKFENLEKKIDQSDDRINNNFNTFKDAMSLIFKQENNNKTEMNKINENLKDMTRKLNMTQIQNKMDEVLKEEPKKVKYRVLSRKKLAK